MPPDAPLHLAFDTGGTFTDLTVDGVGLFKAPSTPDDPMAAVLLACDLAAAELGCGRRDLLGRAAQVSYGTTRATNAVVEGSTATTALLLTAGHPDVLLWREDGRIGTFDFTVSYPEPYVPRRLTVEVPERVGAAGEVVTPLDEAETVAALRRLPALGVEAVAVCLLWSILNPAHELRVGELVAEHLPGVPCTLSHALTPSVREYRRASAAALDASLKPLMGTFLREAEARLREEGFTGRVLVVTSAGGVLDVDAVADAPIHAVASGPAAAPVAGRRLLDLDGLGSTAIVTDAGGTSFDVSLVRGGDIPWTRRTMVGPDPHGPMTGFPSVDVTSVGAGGGSIAWLDGEILRVGPRSAGAVPGPACYGAGGEDATVTDACVVLGYLAPERFLDGAVRLHQQRAHDAVERAVAAPLGMTVEEAAAAILEVATERMIGAIEEVVVGQGVDPRRATIVSGGGAGGFYAGAIARRLGCPRVVVPEAAAGLSAVGAYVSDLVADVARTLPVSTARFPRDDVNAMLAELGGACGVVAAGVPSDACRTTYSVEARYPQQVWDLEVPLSSPVFADEDDVEALRRAFHGVHLDALGTVDERSPVETTTWHAKVRCPIGPAPLPTTCRVVRRPGDAGTRAAWFPGAGTVDAAVRALRSLAPGERLAGPAIVEGRATTIVVEPGAHAERLASGSLLLVPGDL